MATLTITLSEESLTQLREKAERLHIAPEDLSWAGLEELLSRPDEDFAVEYVLTKNAELYWRLATV